MGSSSMDWMERHSKKMWLPWPVRNALSSSANPGTMIEDEVCMKSSSPYRGKPLLVNSSPSVEDPRVPASSVGVWMSG